MVDLPLHISMKRPFEGAPNEEEVMNSHVKRQKGGEDTHDTTGATLYGKKNQFTAPVLHCVPKSMIPILHEPLRPDDLFSNIDFLEIKPEFSRHINNILRRFPPPIPPYLSKDASSIYGGLMIPFIFPPPLINTNRITNKQKNTEGQHNNESGTNNEGNEMQFMDLPPLPFPPPNYIPYPLISDKSSLDPSEVFEIFLKALKHLPRVDMVVASAAGSLFSLRLQATEEGITSENYEKIKTRVTQELFQDSQESEEDDNEYSEDEVPGIREFELKEYLRGIDTSEEFDPFDKSNKVNTVEVYKGFPTDWLDVQPNLSNVKRKVQERDTLSFSEAKNETKTPESEDFEFDIRSVLSQSSKDVISANGSNKGRRRLALAKSLEELHDFEVKEKEKLFHLKKQQLLRKIERLKLSECLFLDNENSIKDEELLGCQNELAEVRDIELLRLKLNHNYETFKNLLTFYRSSNRVFKNFNAVFNSKLMRLKNFFEYQRNLIEGYITENDSKESIFDVKNKESLRLFFGMSNIDYHSKIRDILKNNGKKASKESEQNAAHVPTNQVVHDFMPLASSEELRIICDMQSKGYGKDSKMKISENMKDQVFLKPIYDAVTSGSESNNTSESGTGITPTKRRGRRGNNDNEKSSKYSEAELLAKIMKHFVGPSGANSEELKDDLEMMGLKSRWPVHGPR